MPTDRASERGRKSGAAVWLVPLAALVAVLPLALHGPSCGKDFAFHLQSWMDAAAQLRHGALYPRWTFGAAYNAGEPRFIFYPPLSWMLGAVLTGMLPFPAVPAMFTFVVLCIAGVTMYRLARMWGSPLAAALAACVYLANPFMLFTVATRSAYGELLAAAWCPLLFAAMLSDRPNPWSIGLPLALMWLSNVPGGVIATYLLLLLAAIRLVVAGRDPELRRTASRLRGLIDLGGRFLGGLAFGLALPAVYLLPAVYERRFIHMNDAFPPGMRVADNLLFQRRLDPVRDAFLLRTEHVAEGIFLAVLVTLAAGWFLYRRRKSQEAAIYGRVVAALLCVAGPVACLLTVFSGPVWRTLPGLWVVQFPWRALFVIGVCLAAAVALLFRRVEVRRRWAAVVCVVVVAAMAFPALSLFQAPCGVRDGPAALLASFERHHSPDPTDEYVSAQADAEWMRPDNPPFWLAADAGAYAPGTTPNRVSVDPLAPMPAVPSDARLSATPLQFSVLSPTPAYLVVNLEDYPNWRLSRNGGDIPPHVHRPDGLIAIGVPAGVSVISIHWRHSIDEWLGGTITAMVLLLWGFVSWREKRRHRL